MYYNSLYTFVLHTIHKMQNDSGVGLLMSRLQVRHICNCAVCDDAIRKLGAVSYSPSLVTMAVSVAVCDMFSVNEWCDLENMGRVRSRSLEMARFDRSHRSSYSPYIVTMALSGVTSI